MLPSLPTAMSVMRVEPVRDDLRGTATGRMRKTLAATGSNGKPVSCPT